MLISSITFNNFQDGIAVNLFNVLYCTEYYLEQNDVEGAHPLELRKEYEV